MRTRERREGGKCGWEKKGDHKEPLQLAGDGELEDADMHTNYYTPDCYLLPCIRMRTPGGVHWNRELEGGRVTTGKPNITLGDNWQQAGFFPPLLPSKT